MCAWAGPSAAQDTVSPASAPGTGAAAVAAPSEPPLDTRTQYPRFLANSYLNVNLGYLDYPFSNKQLEPGFHAESVAVRHLAARVVLLGHEFNRHFSVQGTYMRPVEFVAYRNINGAGGSHHVWVNFASITAKPQLPINERFLAYAEAGVGITSRHGFTEQQRPAVRDTHFTSLVFGGGVEYHVNRKWDLTFGGNYSPSSAEKKQPRTLMWSSGFRYNMRPLPQAQVAANRETGYIVPEKLLQFGYTTNGLGYGLNRAVSSKVPLFWGGEVQVAQGAGIQFDRNVFHSRRLFAFDVGASATYLRSRKNGDNFATVSVYPLLRFTLLRTAPADVYLSYSLAGPTLISNFVLDDRVTGRHFTFQDMLGVGMFLGPHRRISAGIKIAHYSNGSIIPDNVGIMMPVTFTIGYSL